MRGAPHNGFSRHMRRLRPRTSGETGGRPLRRERDFQVQKRRKSLRCQATRPAPRQHLAHGHGRRISLERLADAIEDFSDRPPWDFVLFVLEAFVLAQHFMTAVSRNVDDTQRLRLVLEEEGLTVLAPKPLGFFPTPDRLETGLSLMSEWASAKRIRPTETSRSKAFSCTIS